MASSFGSEMGGCILLRLRPHQGRWKLNHEERFASEGKACSGGSSSKRVDVESLHKKVVFQKRKFCRNCSSSEDRRYVMVKPILQKTTTTLLGMKAKEFHLLQICLRKNRGKNPENESLTFFEAKETRKPFHHIVALASRSKLAPWRWNKCHSTRNSLSCSDLISEFQSSFANEFQKHEMMTAIFSKNAYGANKKRVWVLGWSPSVERGILRVVGGKI